MTIIHKPFDLEKALAGEPFGNKNGQKVIEFYFFKNKQIKHPLCVLFSDDEFFAAYTKNGKFHFYNDYDEADLVMYCEEEEQKQDCFVCDGESFFICTTTKPMFACTDCWYKIVNDCLLMQDSYLHKTLKERISGKNK
jgi:hypothetical protein